MAGHGNLDAGAEKKHNDLIRNAGEFPADSFPMPAYPGEAKWIIN